MSEVKEFSTLKCEFQNNIAEVTITRPKAMNALNQDVLSDLSEALKWMDGLNDIRCMILTGEGKAFVAGADIKEMQNHTTEQSLEMSKKGQALFTQIENLPFATIAAVNGFALGGGLELAMSCDFILASEKAKLGLPEVSLGLIPGYGGTQRLTRLVGKATAQRMIYSGDMVSAAQADKWGLVAEVFAADVFMEEARKVAASIAAKGPLAVSFAKRAVHTGIEQNLEESMDTEATYFSKCFATSDKTEGIAAFIEKRPAVFRGE